MIGEVASLEFIKRVGNLYESDGRAPGHLQPIPSERSEYQDWFYQTLIGEPDLRQPPVFVSKVYELTRLIPNVLKSGDLRAKVVLLEQLSEILSIFPAVSASDFLRQLLVKALLDSQEVLLTTKMQLHLFHRLVQALQSIAGKVNNPDLHQLAAGLVHLAQLEDTEARLRYFNQKSESPPPQLKSGVYALVNNAGHLSPNILGFIEQRFTPESYPLIHQVLDEPKLPALDKNQPPFIASIELVPPAILEASSWTPGCPISPHELRYVTVTHWNFKRQPTQGKFIVHAVIAARSVAIFRKLFEGGFPIESFKIADKDSVSPTRHSKRGAKVHSGAFVCRNSTDGTGFSLHTYGYAVDLNPKENPMVLRLATIPQGSTAYRKRQPLRKGMIPAWVVKVFKEHGFKWGGDWKETPDFMHFYFVEDGYLAERSKVTPRSARIN